MISRKAKKTNSEYVIAPKEGCGIGELGKTISLEDLRGRRKL